MNEQGEEITNQYVDDLKAKNAELERDNRILREVTALMDKYSREDAKKFPRR